MNDSEILELAKSVREWAVSEAPKEGQDPVGLSGMCALASLRLSVELRRLGAAHEISHGHTDGCHVWVTLDCGTIVDVTATQFGGPEVYVSKDTAPGFWTYKSDGRYTGSFEAVLQRLFDDGVISGRRFKQWLAA